MAELNDTQIQTLRNKGLSEEKIQALAYANGYSLPKKGFLRRTGEALTQSTRRFGQSLAGALGSTALSSERKGLEETNQRARDVQTNLMRTIKEKRAKGEDTTRLINTLKSLDKEVNFYDILNANTGGSLDKTTGQILGEAAGVATDVLAFGTLPLKGFQALKAAKTAGGFIRGAKEAAKVGALSGGAFGAAQGASLEAQEGGDIGKIAGATVKGGFAGASLGGVVGVAIGGVTGRIAGKAQRVENKALDYALDFVSPEPTKAMKIAAGKEGRVTTPGLLRPAKITPSTRDYRIAEVVEDVISPKNSVPKNIDLIDNRVSEINAGVIDFIKKNKIRPFNENQLRAKLNAGSDDLRLVFASDATAERTYKAVVDELMRHVAKKDAVGLLQARQAFDSVPAIKKLLSTQGVGENTRKEILLQVRRAANEYIADLLPEGNVYKEALRSESYLLEALLNAAKKNQSTIGKNKIQILTQKYPILKWVVGGIAVGVAGAAGVGVGGTIIGSSE